MDWLRYYTNTLESQKVQALPAALFKAWVNLLCIARIFDGVIPPTAEVAFRLRVSDKQATQWLNDLQRRNLLNVTEHGELVPHDWDEHQYPSDDAAGRKRAYRSKKLGQRTGHERDKRTGQERDNVGTSPVLEQNRAEQSRADTEETHGTRAPLQSRKLVTDVAVPVSEKFEAFWEKYPRKQRRDFACSQWVSLVTRENEGSVFECLERYCKSDEVARGVVQNPDKWLYEQQRNGWAGDWPKARSGKTSMEQNVTRTILESLEKGESPW